MNEKTIESKYRKLSEVLHCLQRPFRYVGSVKAHTAVEFLPNADLRMEKREITYTPGFLKLFDEIITNSADHSRTPEGKHLNTVHVEVNQATGEISVHDNGGIPVVRHPEYGQWIPEMIFELRAGSNFDDDDQADLGGQNGEGAALTCIFSKTFTVETCDGKNQFKMTFSENSQTRPEPTVVPARGQRGHTKITYLPEFERFDMSGIDQGNFDILYARTVEIAGTNPHLKVYFNGKQIPVHSFKDYIRMFRPDDAEIVFDDTPFFKVGLLESAEGFQHTSFVSCVRTRVGGTHVAYVTNQIVEALREYIRKKHKIDVKPSDVRNHMHLFVDCRIVNPRFLGQTKDELLTEPNAYSGTKGDDPRQWAVPEKFISKLLKTSIVQSILDWAEAKAAAALAAEVRKVGKQQSKADPRKVEKFSDAMERVQRHKCVLFLAEGDSAAKSIQGGRGKNPYIGSYPLRGKLLNVREKEISRVLGLDKKKEKEQAGKKVEPNKIQTLLTIMGLQIGVPVTSLAELRFGKVAFCTDADVDGFHISGLLMNLIDHFWPELFTLGFVHIFRTPIVVVTLRNGAMLEFFTERDFTKWEEADGSKLKGWSRAYYKGLAKWDTNEFAQFLANTDRYMYKVTMDDDTDRDALDLAFNGTRADDRKAWLETPAANFEDFITETP